MRILSGVQSSGTQHLGNYFGAIQQHIQLQDEGNAECFYFIADYHSLTTIHDAEKVRGFTADLAATYLALGLDPNRSTFYRQSDLPQVTELTWMLSSVAGMGLLERAHSFKDKTARGIRSNVALFSYPVLMAADILIVRSNLVPVGQDQVQHIEMAQDMAQSFNSAYDTDILVRPESRLSKSPKVPGTDRAKMSKSYNNTIGLFDEGKSLKKSVMGIVTSSAQKGDRLPVEDDVVLELYSLFDDPEGLAEMKAGYQDGSMGYGDAKKRLLAKIDETFAPARERRKELLADPDYVEDILRTGARRAREIADETMAVAREVCGFGKMF